MTTAQKEILKTANPEIIKLVASLHLDVAAIYTTLSTLPNLPKLHSDHFQKESEARKGVAQQLEKIARQV